MSDRQTPSRYFQRYDDSRDEWLRAMASAYFPGCPDPDYRHWVRTGEVWPGQKSAARGASEYRDDQPAGVVNSRQAAQGSIVDAGVAVRHADPHTPGNCQPSKPRARFDDRRGCWVLHPLVA